MYGFSFEDYYMIYLISLQWLLMSNTFDINPFILSHWWTTPNSSSSHINLSHKTIPKVIMYEHWYHPHHTGHFIKHAKHIPLNKRKNRLMPLRQIKIQTHKYICFKYHRPHHCHLAYWYPYKWIEQVLDH